MKTVFTLLITSFFFSTLLAQIPCDPPDRFFNEVFPQTPTAVTVEYSDVYNLEMDIYEPVGDTYDYRPMIVFFHGGSFTGGSKTNPTMITMCERFAKRGYVTASASYRLTSAGNLLDSILMINTVMEAISDGKAAVRYLRQNATTYGIDPGQVFVGGNSAGAILAMHMAYIDEAELPNLEQHLQDAVANSGGWEGNSGNPGVTGPIQAVINLAGGLNRLEMIQGTEPPVVSAHGTADGTVPYDCGPVFSGSISPALWDLVDLCGSGQIHPVLDGTTIANALLTYPGDDHVPWETNNAKMEQTITHVSDFIGDYAVCNSPVTSIDNAILQNAINLYPNPASSILNIEVMDANIDANKFSLIDVTGIVVKEIELTSNKVDVSDLSTGIYFVRIDTASGSITKKLTIK